MEFAKIDPYYRLGVRISEKETDLCISLNQFFFSHLGRIELKDHCPFRCNQYQKGQVQISCKFFPVK